MTLEEHWKRLRGADRAEAMASLLVLGRAMPGLGVPPHIFDWTLAEAKQWAGLLESETRSKTAAWRATTFFELSSRSAEKAALQQEARRYFELVSANDRKRMPGLWLEILLATEPVAIVVALPKILNAARKAMGRNRKLMGFRLVDPRMPENARAIISAWIDTLEDWEVEPSVRFQHSSAMATAALEAAQLRQAAVRIREMTRWAAYSEYLGGSLGVLVAAANFSSLHTECLALIEVVLRGERAPKQRKKLSRMRTRLMKT